MGRIDTFRLRAPLHADDTFPLKFPRRDPMRPGRTVHLSHRSKHFSRIELRVSGALAESLSDEAVAHNIQVEGRALFSSTIRLFYVKFTVRPASIVIKADRIRKLINEMSAPSIRYKLSALTSIFITPFYKVHAVFTKWRLFHFSSKIHNS
jgi:hypothetical protein